MIHPMQINVIISAEPVAYPEAIAFMDRKAQEVIDGAQGTIWLLEHPHSYTLGTSGQDNDVIDLAGIPIFKSNRGGRITYHGPGQCVMYAMLNLEKLYNKDLHKFIEHLQHAAINTLKRCNINSFTRPKRIGVWCNDIETTNELKIAAVGVRVRKWVSLHGIAINVNPDLTYFNRIIPCGLKGYGVTSCNDQRAPIDIATFKLLLINEFVKLIDIPIELKYEND